MSISYRARSGCFCSIAGTYKGVKLVSADVVYEAR